MAAAEEILKLYDSCWFQQEILKSRQCSFVHDESKVLMGVHLDLKVRSQSDNTLLRFGCPQSDSLEKPVIFNPELQVHMVMKKKAFERKKKRASGKKLGGARSLSELELEELKGFMDLGFVFTDEDKNSSLASIIPGLQRRRSRATDDDGGGGEEEITNEHGIERPYLSEAWGVMDQRKIIKKLLKWRFPPLTNESSMKDNLRFWAQTVASALR